MLVFISPFLFGPLQHLFILSTPEILSYVQYLAPIIIKQQALRIDVNFIIVYLVLSWNFYSYPAMICVGNEKCSVTHEQCWWWKLINNS